MNLPYTLLPDVRWFVIGLQQSQFSILQNAPFQKQNGHNRYAIGGPNNIQPLSVPVHHDDRNLPLPHVRINYNQNWIKDHKQAWQTAYGKSPFFEYYDYRFWAVFNEKPTTMQDLIEGCNQVLFTNLKINQQPQYSPAPEAEKSRIAQKLLTPYYQEYQTLTLPNYPQVFDTKFGFRSPLSAIDLLFNLGPLAPEYFQPFQQFQATTP
ncbi:MAG: WbqC family protein [Bacteroidota bacterium]